MYDKRRDQWYDDKDVYTEKELKARNAQIAKGMFKQDIELKEEWARTHRHGYCPHCHLLLPATGKCDCQN